MRTGIERIYATLLDQDYQRVIFGDLGDFQRKGNAYIARCPFHEDALPTLVLYGDRPEYFCFACSRRGDWLKFLQKRLEISFPEAFSRLARAAGVDAAADDETAWEADLHRSDLLENAMSFFITRLWAEEGACDLAYLYKRGYSMAEVEGMALGSYPGYVQTRDYLLSQGFAGDHLERTLSCVWNKETDSPGLAIPFRDASGRLMGLLCRDIATLGAPAYRPLTDLKPLADTPFLLYRSRGQAEVIVVEGIFDALLLDQVRLKPVMGVGSGGLSDAGIEAAAACGTRHFVLALGNGVRRRHATLEAIGRIRAKGLDVSVLPIPRRYSDLDAYIRGTCLDHFRSLLKKAIEAEQWIEKKSR